MTDLGREMKRLARIAQRLGLPVTREWLKRVRAADRGAYVALRALLRHFRMNYGADEPVRSLLQLDAQSRRLQLVWPQGRLLVLQDAVRQTPVRHTEAKQLSKEKRHERRLYELLRAHSQQADPSTLACAMLVTGHGPYAHYATDPALRLVALRRATADPALNTVVANRTLEALRELFQQARKLLETSKEKKRQRSASGSSTGSGTGSLSSSSSDSDDSESESESEEDSGEDSEEESEASSSSVTLGSADSSDDSSFSFNETQLAEVTSSSSESSGEPTPSSSSSEEQSGNVTTSDSDEDQEACDDVSTQY